MCQPTNYFARLAGCCVALALVCAILPAARVEARSPRAATPLSPIISAELQNLLRAQMTKKAVRPQYVYAPGQAQTTYQRLFAWNEIALDTTAIDHTPVPPGGHYVFGQQFGPARAARAMAIVHIAMFEAVNAIRREYQTYTGLSPAQSESSIDYAIAQSAHDALAWLYPSQLPRLDGILAADVAHMHGHEPFLAAGRTIGHQAANSIIVMRTNDG